jgi:hypothetical protein
MARFLIEVPHEAETLACARAAQELLQSGSHLLTHADFGCHDGTFQRRPHASLARPSLEFPWGW